MNSSSSSTSPKIIQTNKKDHEEFITLNEKTKSQQYDIES